MPEDTITLTKEEVREAIKEWLEEQESDSGAFACFLQLDLTCQRAPLENCCAFCALCKKLTEFAGGEKEIK